MRKYLSAILFAFVTTSLSAQIKFTIVGKVIADSTKEILIKYNGETSSIPVLTNGKFSYSGSIKSSCKATLIFSEEENEDIWVENGTIEILIVRKASSKTEIKIASLKGPENSESYFKISQTKSTLYNNHKNINDPLIRSDTIYQQLFSLINHFVRKNPQLGVSIDLIRLSGLNYREKEYLVKEIDKSFNAEYIDFLAEEIQREKILEPGNTFDDFSMAKPDGSVFNLNQTKSKYILLEFWSSWCIPCRQMRPGLSSTYKKYREKGLEIVGVSLDDNRVEWIKAIEKDNVAWIEISDLKGFKSALAIKYKINAVPYWILIDKDRKIINYGFWNVSDETLQKLMP